MTAGSVHAEAWLPGVPGPGVSCSSSGTVFFTAAGPGQAFFVASASSCSYSTRIAGDLYTEIGVQLRSAGLQIVHERVFGSLAMAPRVMAERQAALASHRISSQTPVTFVDGSPAWGSGFAGVIIHAVAAAGADQDPWTIMDGGRACGRGWRRGDATFLMLQNLQGGGNGVRVAPAEQTLGMLGRAERMLRQEGACYRDVVRTWFYLSDILSWYDQFNAARNHRYGELGIMPGPGREQLLLPASTGIRGDTPLGGAAAMDLLAVVDPTGSVQVRQLSNTVQQDAFCYGSAFSRGAVISQQDVALIEVSGTAAIDEQGQSLYPGDIRSQIACTLDKVETLLGQAGAGLADICAATVFVKRAEHAPIYREMAAVRGLEQLPAVVVVADVCRDELLFEIDAEAAISCQGLA